MSYDYMAITDINESETTWKFNALYFYNTMHQCKAWSCAHNLPSKTDADILLSTFALHSPKAIHLLPWERGEIWGRQKLGGDWGVVCWNTKVALSLKCVKIEEKLLWMAYRNSPTLFRTVPSPRARYGLFLLKIGGLQLPPKTTLKFRANQCRQRNVWRAYRNRRHFLTVPFPTPRLEACKLQPQPKTPTGTGIVSSGNGVPKVIFTVGTAFPGIQQLVNPSLHNFL